MTFAVDVHQVEFVNQAVPLQQPQSPVHGAAVDAGIQLLGFAQKLGRIQVLRGSFHHAQNCPPLLGHADSAVGKMRLKPPGHFSLGQWHGERSSTRRNWSQPRCDGIFRWLLT
jgi:hypothetical protein